jgi:hypothetical protein
VPPRDAREVGDRRQLREADDAEVRLVHAEQHGGLGADRRLEVRRPRAVRRSYLDQPRAGPRQHIRDPEPVPDLDQLAAGDDDLPAFGERRERKQDRGRVVVDDQRGLSAGKAAQDARYVILARAARPRLQVVLEIRVAAADLANALECRLGEGSAPEIRVDDDARRVQRPPQLRRSRRGQLGPQPFAHVARIGACLDLFTRAREDTPRGLDGERVVAPARELVDRGQVAQPHCASALFGSAGTSAQRVS